MKDKGNQKKFQFGISKNCKMQIPRGKAGKTLIAVLCVSFYRTL